MALDTVLTGVPEGPFRNLAALWSGGGELLLGELPGDAWGRSRRRSSAKARESLFDSFAGAIGGAAIAAQVKQATGLDLQQDVFSWIGDVGAVRARDGHGVARRRARDQSTDDAGPRRRSARSSA